MALQYPPDLGIAAAHHHSRIGYITLAAVPIIIRLSLAVLRPNKAVNMLSGTVGVLNVQMTQKNQEKCKNDVPHVVF